MVASMRRSRQMAVPSQPDRTRQRQQLTSKQPESEVENEYSLGQEETSTSRNSLIAVLAERDLLLEPLRLLATTKEIDGNVICLQ